MAGTRRNIPERVYRLSRLHRVLGNPTASGILDLLLRLGVQSPTLLARRLKTTVPNVSHALYKLRLAEVVRYSRERRVVRYDLKYPDEIRQYVRTGMRFIDRSSRRLAKDR
ncbi:MAG: winged helix-turn-helix transcriptional regulator [Planctomycetes bacterium]|nr:winged helix-turn-helix transcriptional regulator [Planctomycetota bacterium]